ncbi:glycosyltransferase family 4 protein [Candidatus Poribacteria bacterium]|nr:glycosyltransferase family 4 protein [Candidatus Poribacteria bacterium]
MKLACIGPLSPGRTGVAGFTESLLPYLRQRCEVHLFTDRRSSGGLAAARRFPVEDISVFLSNPSAYDAALYNMGNHYRFHKRVFEALTRVPSMALLHDCVLNQFFAKYTLERGDFGAFSRLVQLCWPNVSSGDVAQFMSMKGDPYRFPMAGVVAACSRGTIVMTEYGRSIVLKEAPRANVLKVNFPYFPIDSGRTQTAGLSAETQSESAQAFREKFGIPARCFVVASVGHMTPAKRIDVALEAFRKFNAKFPESVFLLSGEVSPRFPLARSIERGNFKNVKYLGYLARSELDGLMEIADVCVNLRYPSNGEMSASLIEMLGRGKLVAVSNYAQFAEFPDPTCVKIDIGPSESLDLADTLMRLVSDANRRHVIGLAARDYISRNHSPEAAADAIVSFAGKQSRSEPLLPPEEVGRLLKPDNLLIRFRQMAAYNAKRLRVYRQEQGIAETIRQTLRRVSAGTQ